jgi:hypothetical protein
MMWTNIVESYRPQLKVQRMCIACWLPKATDIYSEYVILIAFPLQLLPYEAYVRLYIHTLPPTIITHNCIRIVRGTIHDMQLAPPPSPPRGYYQPCLRWVAQSFYILSTKFHILFSQSKLIMMNQEYASNSFDFTADIPMCY